MAMQQRDYSQAFEHDGWVAQWAGDSRKCRVLRREQWIEFHGRLHLDCCLAPPGRCVDMDGQREPQRTYCAYVACAIRSAL